MSDEKNSAEDAKAKDEIAPVSDEALDNVEGGFSLSSGASLTVSATQPTDFIYGGTIESNFETAFGGTPDDTLSGPDLGFLRKRPGR